MKSNTAARQLELISENVGPN